MRNRGKLVYCQETFQVFPSAKVAAETTGIGYYTITNNLEGRATHAKGKHFIYIENTSDLSNFFADKRKEEKEKATIRKEAEAKLIKLSEEAAAAREAQKKIAAEMAEIRKTLKKCM